MSQDSVGTMKTAKEPYKWHAPTDVYLHTLSTHTCLSTYAHRHTHMSIYIRLSTYAHRAYRHSLCQPVRVCVLCACACLVAKPVSRSTACASYACCEACLVAQPAPANKTRTAGPKDRRTPTPSDPRPHTYSLMIPSSHSHPSLPHRVSDCQYTHLNL